MTVLRSYPWLVSWSSPAFGFFLFSILLSPEVCDPLPGLKRRSCGSGAPPLRSVNKLFAYPGVWDFLLSGTSLPILLPGVSEGLPSQAAGRGAERVQPFPTPQTLWQPPCPCSDRHLSLSGARRRPSGCCNSTHRQGSHGRTENWKVVKHIPFFPSLSHSRLLYLSFACLLACLFLLGNRYGALGRGPRGHQQVFHSHCVSRDPFTTALAAEPAQAVCFPSLCLLSLAGTSLFPVPSFSGMPVSAS